MPTNFPTAADTFPSAALLASQTLASSPHSTLHGNLGDALTAVEQSAINYIAALGKVTTTGFTGLPTLFNPANTTWNQSTFVQIDYATAMATFGSIGAGNLWTLRTYGESPDATHNIFATLQSRAPTNAGNDGQSAVVLNSTDFAGVISIDYTAAYAAITVMGQAGQTAALLDLQDSASLSIFSVTPDGKVGGVAPSDGWSIKWHAATGQWIAAA